MFQNRLQIFTLLTRESINAVKDMNLIGHTANVLFNIATVLLDQFLWHNLPTYAVL